MAEAHETPGSLLELPLFPLNTVLFPGMALPLHIFEERYKAMIGDCVEQEQPFGVVLIRSGKEAGGPAEPFSIGTTARVVKVERLEEGRMNILTAGERRFETHDVTQRTPHLVGQVKYLEEEPGEPSEEALAQFREEYGEYLKNLSSLAGGWTSQAATPQDPVTLSYRRGVQPGPAPAREADVAGIAHGRASIGTPVAHGQAGQHGGAASDSQAQPLPRASAKLAAAPRQFCK